MSSNDQKQTTPVSSEGRWEKWKQAGILRPQTAAASVAIETYLLHGNGTAGRTEEERVEILRSYQNLYISRSVQHRHNHRTGQVLWLVPRQPKDVRSLVEQGKDPIFPFRAHVRWTKQSAGQTSLVDLIFSKDLDH